MLRALRCVRPDGPVRVFEKDGRGRVTFSVSPVHAAFSGEARELVKRPFSKDENTMSTVPSLRPSEGPSISSTGFVASLVQDRAYYLDKILDDPL